METSPRIVQISDPATGETKPWERFSSRVEKFWLKFPLADGYRVKHTVKPAIALMPELVELYRLALSSGLKPSECGLPSLPKGVVMTVELLDPQGNFVAHGLASTTMELAFTPGKDFEITDSAAFQRLLAGIGFAGDVFDRDEQAIIDKIHDKATAPTHIPTDDQGSAGNVVKLQTGQSSPEARPVLVLKNAPTGTLELPEAEDPVSLFQRVTEQQSSESMPDTNVAETFAHAREDAADQSEEAGAPRLSDSAIRDIFDDLGNAKAAVAASETVETPVEHAEVETGSPATPNVEVTATAEAETNGVSESSASEKAPVATAVEQPAASTKSQPTAIDEKQLRSYRTVIKLLASTIGEEPRPVTTVEEAKAEQARLADLSLQRQSATQPTKTKQSKAGK